MSEWEECPEDCGLILREAEMIAHLEWDHNYREPEAERKVAGECSFE